MLQHKLVTSNYSNPNACLGLSLFHGSIQIFIPSISPPLAAQVSWSARLSWAGSWLRPQHISALKKQNISANFLRYIFHSFHWTTCGLIVTGSALKGLAVTSPGKHRGVAKQELLGKWSFQTSSVHLHVVCFHLPIQPAHSGSGRTKMRRFFRKMQHATLLHWCQVAIILRQGLSKLAGLRPW